MKRRRKLKVRVRASEQQAEALFAAAEYFESIGANHVALRCLQEAAKAGHDLSQHQLGNLYAAGRGVRKNLLKAQVWYKKAFYNRTRTISYSSPAVSLAVNLKKSGDLAGAIRWFEKARALEDGGAYVELARIYAERKHGRKKAEMLLREMLKLNSENVTEVDRENANALLAKMTKN
jgi:tetratricopeptide (TPR) repeat protein